MTHDITILYFAWVREKIGKSSETLTLDNTVNTVADLIALLKAKGGGYQIAFQDSDAIKVAVNQDYVDQNYTLEQAQEIAFFPPVTGG